MDYKTKYLKYKTKYLNLSRKIQFGGDLSEEQKQQLIKKIYKGIGIYGYNLLGLSSFLESDTVSIANILNTIGEIPININLSDLPLDFNKLYGTNKLFKYMLQMPSFSGYSRLVWTNLNIIKSNNLPIEKLPISLQNLITEMEQWHGYDESEQTLSKIMIIDLHMMFKDNGGIDKFKVYDTIFDENGHYRIQPEVLAGIKPAVIKRSTSQESDDQESYD